MRLLSISTVYGANDPTPYMTRVVIGRFRLHIFYRGDLDPDPHDHPWGFWTFPLTSYVEEVTEPHPDPTTVSDGDAYRTRWQVVRSWRLHHRPATHTHRVLGRFVPGLVPSHIGVDPHGRVITLVWRERKTRANWGFLKLRDGRWCWQYWRDYINGGRDTPCD